MKCPSCSTENRTSAKSGEAGLGKSRLMAEWRKAVRMEGDEPPVRWVEGRCLSYGGSVAYHLGIDILRSLVGDIAGARESFQPMWRPGGDPVRALQGFTVAGPGIAAWSAADGQLEHGLSFCDWILG